MGVSCTEVKRTLGEYPRKKQVWKMAPPQGWTSDPLAGGLVMAHLVLGKFSVLGQGSCTGCSTRAEQAGIIPQLGTGCLDWPTGKLGWVCKAENSSLGLTGWS